MAEQPNDFQAAFMAGLLAADIRTVEGVPLAVVPQGAGLVELERLLPHPMRASGSVALNDAESFIRVVNDHKTDSTRIYSSKERFVAVFDEHQRGQPGWRGHRAIYSCPLAVEWQTWMKHNAKPMSQVEFARFVEDNLPDIAMPPAAEMLEISRSLEAKKKVSFASGIRLSNGQNELVYEEQISGTAAKGKLAVPEEFVVGIPVLEGGIRYAVTARLRYRIADTGGLTMWYELLRPHKVVEDAIKEVSDTIAEKTEVVILAGSAD